MQQHTYKTTKEYKRHRPFILTRWTVLNHFNYVIRPASLLSMQNKENWAAPKSHAWNLMDVKWIIFHVILPLHWIIGDRKCSRYGPHLWLPSHWYDGKGTPSSNRKGKGNIKMGHKRLQKEKDTDSTVKHRARGQMPTRRLIYPFFFSVCSC